MSTPNREAIREWVADLRSGDFKQGSGRLRRGDRYCCLGVACETFSRVTGEGEWVEEDTGFRFSADGVDFYSILMPALVAEWLGLESIDPRLKFPRSSAFCTVANDDKRKDFAAIANALERTYLTDAPPS